MAFFVSLCCCFLGLIPINTAQASEYLADSDYYEQTIKWDSWINTRKLLNSATKIENSYGKTLEFYYCKDKTAARNHVYETYDIAKSVVIQPVMKGTYGNGKVLSSNIGRWYAYHENDRIYLYPLNRSRARTLPKEAVEVGAVLRADDNFYTSFYANFPETGGSDTAYYQQSTNRYTRIGDITQKMKDDRRMNLVGNAWIVEEVTAYDLSDDEVLCVRIRSYKSPGKITLNQKSMSLYPGKSTSMEAQLSSTDSIYEGKIRWSSSNYDVVTVSRTGIVKARKPGKATITAYLDNSLGTFSSATVTVLPYDVSLTGIVQTNEGIKITWKETETKGANGHYYLNRIDEKGNREEVFRFTDEYITSYVDTSIPSGKKYSYELQLQMPFYTQCSQQSESIFYLSKPVISFKNTADSVRIIWKKVPGATSYSVYRKGMNDKSWTKLAKVGGSSLEYEDKTASEGKKYYYTVKAARGTTQSFYQKNLSWMFLGKTEVSAKQAQIYKYGKLSVAVSLRWNIVHEAREYDIYRKKNGETTWKKISTVRNPETHFLDGDVREDTDYAYTVVAKNGTYRSATAKTVKLRTTQSDRYY